MKLGRKQKRYHCQHGRRKSTCKECGGSSICPHDRIKSQCKECGGGRICEHGRRKSTCKECGGNSICPHGRQKSQCKECGGSSICPHNRRKSQCKECGGSSICPHNRQKSTCKECVHTTIPKALCKICVTTRLTRRRQVTGVCAKCDPMVPPRTEHTFGELVIQSIGFEPNQKDTTFVMHGNCRDLSRRRPDMAYIIPGQVAVVIEIDEDSHSDRLPECELAKVSNQNESIRRMSGCAEIPCYTIRVNPDVFDGGLVSRKKRAETVAGLCRHLLDPDTRHSSLCQKTFFCFYHSKSIFLIEAARQYSEVEVITTRHLPPL